MRIDFELELPGGPAEVRITGNRDVVAGWLERHRGPVAFDVETTALEPTVGRLRTLQLGSRDSVLIIPARRIAVIASELAELVQPIAHNGLFDALWLEHAGVDMTPIVARLTDTQAMAHLYDPRPAYRDPDADEDDEGPVGLGLKELAVRFLGPGADRYERQLAEAFDLPPSGRGKRWQAIWASIPDADSRLLMYAGADVVLTCRLYDELAMRLTTEEHELLDVERQITLEAWRIMVAGLVVDATSAAAVRDGLLAERERLDKELERYAVTNADSPVQSSAALLAVGAPLTERTPGGKLSTGKAVLEGLAEHASGPGAELAGLLRQARRARSYATKYAGKLASSELVHPFVRVNGARTGRWAMASPPVQQWPKRPLETSSASYDLRALLLAPEGQVLVSCDLTSIEAVVGAAVSRDRNLIAAVDKPLGEPLTIYEDLAEQLGVSRPVAKVVVLAGMYGVGNAKLAVQLGTDDRWRIKKLRAETFGGYWCDDRECELINGDPVGCVEHIVWDDGFYGGPRRFRRILEQGEVDVEQREGWPGVRNLFGRWVPARVRYGAGTPDWFTIFNHDVQGSARDLLMRMLLEVRAAGLTPWLTVHDEIIVVVDEADAPEARRALLEIMSTERHDVIGLPIHAEAGTPASRWGSQGAPVR